MEIESTIIGTSLPDGFKIVKLERRTIIGNLYRVKSTVRNEAESAIEKNSFLLKIPYEKLILMKHLDQQFEKLKYLFLNKSISPNSLNLKQIINVQNGDVCLVYEGIFGFSLRDLATKKELKQSSFLKFREIIQQIIKFFYDLKIYKICHQNLTLDNIFIDNNTIKVAGYEFFDFEGKTKKFLSGSIQSLPFEQLCQLNLFLSKQQANIRIFAKQEEDIWAIGVLAYELLSGKLYLQPNHRFSIHTVPELLLEHVGISSQRQIELSFLLKDENPILRNLLVQCLELAPANRPNFKTFYEYFGLTISTRLSFSGPNRIKEYSYTESEEKISTFKIKIIHEFRVIQFFRLIFEGLRQLELHIESKIDRSLTSLRIKVLSFIDSLSCLSLLKSHIYLMNIICQMKGDPGSLDKLFPSVEIAKIAELEDFRRAKYLAYQSLAHYQGNKSYSRTFLEETYTKLGEKIKSLMSSEKKPQRLSIILVKLVVIFDENLHNLKSRRILIQESLIELKQYLETNEDIQFCIEREGVNNLKIIFDFLLNDYERMPEIKKTGERFNWEQDCFEKIRPSFNLGEDKFIKIIF